MLVLTRKLGESVCVGQDVEVFVVGVSRGRVKLGFRAPSDVAIQRAEVADHIAVAENVEPIRHAVLSLREGGRTQGGSPLREFRQAGIAEVQPVG
jgi:carbon storage regulator